MIKITLKAAEKAKEVLEKEQANYLRIFTQGGGCSGLQYGMSADKEKNDTDQEFQSEGVKIIVDPISIKYLDGTEIYWDDTNLGGQFAMKNPNAKGTCGCGQSFDPK